MLLVPEEVGRLAAPGSSEAPEAESSIMSGQGSLGLSGMISVFPMGGSGALRGGMAMAHQHKATQQEGRRQKEGDEHPKRSFHGILLYCTLAK